MIDPWTFDIAEGFNAPGGDYKINYEGIHEIAQGSPLLGECYLWKKDEKILISKTCSGPPVWSRDSKYFVVPIWRKLFFQGMIQKIALVDIEEETIKYSKSNYDVVHLIKLENNRLELIDSPAYHPKSLDIKIENIEFEREERLNNIR
jgi:hypothetical protein